MIYEPQSFLEYIFIFSDYPINAERGRYILSLVFLSLLIASVGAFTSLKVIQGIFNAERVEQQKQLHFIAAACLASTIWSMHFVGMLAYDMDMVHTYNLPITFLSMFIAAAVAYGFVAIVRFYNPRPLMYFIGAVLLGSAVSMMHYSGMQAMEMDGKILYKPGLFILSIVIAFIASAVAMRLVYEMRNNQKISFLILSSVIVGLGVCGMHYTGMLATVFLPYANCRFSVDQTYHSLAFLVTAVSALIYTLSYVLMKNNTGEEAFNLRKNWASLTPILVFILGIIIVTFSVIITENTIKKQSFQEFESLTHKVKHGIEDKYALYEQALYGGVGLYEASNYVENEEWKKFISMQKIDKNLSGLNGIGFIEYLQADELPQFEEEYSKKFGKPFKAHPKTDHNEKFIIKYIEPLEKNINAVGLDIGFEENRREAALESIRTGMPTLTKKIELVQDNKSRAGFLLLLPFFQYDEQDTVNASKEIKGWVYAPFIGDNFLKEIVYMTGNKISLAVYDGETISNSNLIYKDRLFDGLPTNNQILRTGTITIAGKIWTIVFKSTPIFYKSVKSYLPLVQIIFGLLLTSLISIIFYNQITREKVVRKLVRSKTQELQDLSDSLEKTVLERTFELEKANQTKDTFLANMSHELRTPLNSILGLIKMLLSEKDIPKEHLLTLETVDKASSSLLSIVNDILDISKIEAGMLILEQQAFDLKGLMVQLAEQLKPLASQKGIGLRHNIDELPETIVVGDKFRLSRIIMNLGGNAAKYTLSGEVNIDVTLKESGIEGVMIYQCCISDTGIGIAEDKIEHIFEKFTQAEESTERNFGGTGLGLNITKQLVEIMDGEIEAQSELGEGSSFTFKIPVKIGNAADLEKENLLSKEKVDKSLSSINKKHAKDASVLIAEDHEFNQIFILKLLKKFGFKNLTLAIDGEETVREYKKSVYDIVLMDCHMPKLNGYDATRQIRVFEQENDDRKYTPIFAMTADAMIGTKETCIDAGMDEYISKPIDADLFKKSMETFFFINDDKLNTNKIDTDGEDSLVNLSVLREYSDSDEEIKELVSMFCDSSLNDIKALEENITEGENEEWSMVAHRMKGGAAYVGAESLRLLCEEAQDMKVATKKERQEKFAEINHCLDAVHDQLKT